jgi:hypothetical protein
MYRSFATLELLSLCLVLVGCQNNSPVQPTNPAVTIIVEPTRPFYDATYTYTPRQAATATAFAPHYDLLHPGEQLRRLGINLETVIEEDDARFSMLPSGQELALVGQEDGVMQTRWQFDLAVVHEKPHCVSQVYVGDIIECRGSRVRIITIFENERALAAWSLVDTPLVPLSQAQITSAYNALLPPDEEGLVLPFETDVTFDESLSLFGSQPKSVEIRDSYVPEAFLKRFGFELVVTNSRRSFKRPVHAGDMLEFDDYRIRVLYIGDGFAYLSVSSPPATD